MSHCLVDVLRAGSLARFQDMLSSLRFLHGVRETRTLLLTLSLGSDISHVSKTCGPPRSIHYYYIDEGQFII